MLDLYSQRQNHLLAALPPPDYKRLSSHLELVHLPQGKVLCEAGALNYVYFPTSSIISLLYLTEDGGCAETAVIGPEGMLGVSVFMGSESTPNQAVVQSGGSACRLSKLVLKQEFDRSIALRQVLLRYTQALITHMAQTAARGMFGLPEMTMLSERCELEIKDIRQIDGDIRITARPTGTALSMSS